jgi:hypothetical protein
MAANEAHKRVETCLKNPIDARFIDHSAYMNDQNDSWPNHTHITMCLTYDTVLNLAHLCARIGSPLTNWLVNGATISSIIESIGSTMMNSESIATITIEWNCSFDICCSNYGFHQKPIASSLKTIGLMLSHMIWISKVHWNDPQRMNGPVLLARAYQQAILTVKAWHNSLFDTQYHCLWWHSNTILGVSNSDSTRHHWFTHSESHSAILSAELHDDVHPLTRTTALYTYAYLCYYHWFPKEWICDTSHVGVFTIHANNLTTSIQLLNRQHT